MASSDWLFTLVMALSDDDLMEEHILRFRLVLNENLKIEKQWK